MSVKRKSTSDIKNGSPPKMQKTEYECFVTGLEVFATSVIRSLKDHAHDEFISDLLSDCTPYLFDQPNTHYIRVILNLDQCKHARLIPETQRRSLDIFHIPLTNMTFVHLWFFQVCQYFVNKKTLPHTILEDVLFLMFYGCTLDDTSCLHRITFFNTLMSALNANDTIWAALDGLCGFFTYHRLGLSPASFEDFSKAPVAHTFMFSL